jgi:glycosyltransferase involved in cell wall biosynthesis
VRILLTTHQFFPEFSAGTEVLTYSVACELRKRGHLVNVLTGFPSTAVLRDEERFDEYEFDGIHVYRFHHSYVPMGGQHSKIEIGYDNKLASDYFERILKIFKPDVVHFFHLNRLGTGLIQRAVQAAIPRFMTPTDFWAVCPMGQLLYGNGLLCPGPSQSAGNCLKHLTQISQGGLVGKIAELLPTAIGDLVVRGAHKCRWQSVQKLAEVAALADRLPVTIRRLNMLNGLIAPSYFMEEVLVRYGVSPSLLSRASFGIDVAGRVSAERSYRYGDPLRIGYIGTLAPHKGCHIIIDAFTSLTNHNAELKVYGCLDDFPEYVADLRKRAKGLDSIKFCGTFPNSRIAEVFSELDVLVVPSLWYENTPLVLYSAQAAGCPVLASNLPGISEVIRHSDNGLLFTPGRSSELAGHLSSLISQDGLLRQLSSRARYPKSSETYVDELLSIWQSAL